MSSQEIATISLSVIAMAASGVSVLVNLYVKSSIGPIVASMNHLKETTSEIKDEQVRMWEKIGEQSESIAFLQGKREGLQMTGRKP